MNNDISHDNNCCCISFLKDAYDYIKTKIVFLYRSIKTRFTSQTVIPPSNSQPEEKPIQSRSSTVIDVDSVPSVKNPHDFFANLDTFQSEAIPPPPFNTKNADNEHSAQENSNLCCKCQSPLDSQWINALDRNWHPECFRCFKCDELIGANRSVELESKPWCEPCYIKAYCPRCNHCQQPIQDSVYSVLEQENYHKQCLQCHYCRAPLTKTIFKNTWGEYYCEKHHDDPLCTSCKRHIYNSESFPFGKDMHTCPQCHTSPEESSVPIEERDKIIAQLKNDLKSLGMDITRQDIPIRFTDHQELNKKDQSPKKHSIGKTVKRLHSINKKEIRRGIKEILIQKDMPRIMFCQTVIHELTHAWVFHNHLALSTMEEEGLCEFMEYLWLEKQKTPLASLHMRLKHQNQCPVYGDGFRKIHSLYNELGSNIETLIARLASKIPLT
ncbi:protein DA1 [Kistimonas asteriae]|uniref:protein DA1 n=1 Tax=Kistimonas asteriae TaxID=517724 RepID=UPI001BA7CF31|nr:protein DA1 [Kistimonas asteriae]